MAGGLLVISLALLLGGFFAYLGSVFGRQIGRRKISFFGLRPRYTALAVTILIGMFISLFTIVIIAFYSHRAKAALMGLEKLERGKRQLEVEIYELNKRERKSAALFQLNEPIAKGEIQPGDSFAEIEQKMRKLLSDASAEVRQRNDEQASFLKRGLSKKEAEAAVLYDEKEFTHLLEEIAARESAVVVLVYSEKNAYFGQKVKVKFNIYSNVLLARKGDRLLSRRVKSEGAEENIFFALMDFLKELERTVEKKGMITIPRGKSSVDIPMTEILTAVHRIEDYRGWVELSAHAVEDIYTAGPLGVQLKITRL